MTEALLLEQVTKTYGDRRVVDGLDLLIQPGSVVALLGPNGAGKSTTMTMCAGFMAPDQGRISVGGVDLKAQREAARALLTYLPENVVLYDELTGRENLSHLLEIGGSRRLRGDEVEQALARTGLPAEAFGRRARTYSKGMRQKVGLALALARGSRLLLLDEPTSGLDPHSAAEFGTALRQAADAGVGVLMATHDIWRAREVADRILVLVRGRLAVELDPQSMSADDVERRFFLEAEAV
jgi:ABC-2 type transport system ATP-binding protein